MRILLLLILTLGCATGNTIVVDGITVYEAHWQRTIEELTKRASFDLDCAEPLSFTLFRKFGRYPTEVGVRGCGRRAVYLRPNAGGQLSPTWVLNSESGTRDD